FDILTKTLAASPSRRSLLKGLGLALGIGALRLGESEAATCRASGQTCSSGTQCCTGQCGDPDRRGRRVCACPPNTLTCGHECCGERHICAGNTCEFVNHPPVLGEQSFSSSW